jgi:hypothetical protein
MDTPAAPHSFRFYRIGGLDQVALETGADLGALRQLDQKLWVALSCPTKGLELDSRTLELLDLDKDGRVRAPELLSAIDWCRARLRDLGTLIPGKDELPLSALSDATPEGRALAGACRQILASRGRKDAETISAADVADVSHVFDGTCFNGDGIVPPDAADDPAVGQVMADAIATQGGLPDRSGRLGLDQAKLDAFYGELAAYRDWMQQGSVEGVLSLGQDTAAGYEAVKAVRMKVEDYFNRCRIAAFDPRAGVIVNRPESELAALAAKDLSAHGEDLKSLPLAHVEAAAPLPLLERTNPAWSGALTLLQKTAVVAVFGPQKTQLTPADWEQLQPRFAAYEQWTAAKKGQSVEKLGLARVEEILAGRHKPAIEALIARDNALSAEADAIADAVRLVHYRRDLHTLLKNFVSFADFYNMETHAVFQAGTLYLDSRSCDLCVRVDDPASHAGLASLSRMYLVYCDCRRPGGETMKIAACFTQGDSDYLMVGRNGVFYDRKGRDWDATIAKIVENPISIRQAFFAPYKKFMRMIEDQVNRIAAAKEKEADARLAATAAAAADAGPLPRAPPAAVDVGKMVGIIAALGVGVGAIGALFGGFVSGFMSLQPWWAKPLALAGGVLAISGPSMALAWLKLRQRTLGPVLDANGWAVNGRVRVNIPLGAALTDLKALPAGSTRSLDDPFEDKASRRRRRLFWAVAGVAAAVVWVLWRFRLGPFGR